jgi:nicotinate-nucleotide adenylyltransferase
MRRVAVFGGSFNPPHIAHVLVAAYVLSMEQVDEFLVVPCFIHPFNKPLASFEDRYSMCQLAFGWLPRVSVSRVEQQLGGASRTVRTLEHLASTHGDWALRLVVGADVISEAPRWHGFERIERLAPPIVLGRVGAGEGRSGMPEVFPDISSTKVRTAIGSNQLEQVRPFVPREVLDYALSRNLYAGDVS